MRKFYAATRDLHLYVGLFLSPFIVVFAVSTVLLNHPRPLRDSAPPAKTTLPVEVPQGVGSVENAKKILAQLHVTGEIDYVRHNAKSARLFIPVAKPTEITRVDVDLRTNTATVERQSRGLGDALIYLHKMPGPHNAAVRGNWLYMVWWGVTTDVVVYGTLFLSVSGLYLWWVLKPERRVGWFLLTGGAASVALLVTAICTA